jgi:glycosyltransferase involved in cell wall biosynthesis
MSTPEKERSTPNSLRIMHVSFHLQGGGAERQLQILATECIKNGADVSVFCVSPVGSEALAKDIQLFVYDRAGKFDFGIFSAAFLAVRTFQPDVLHVWLPPAITIPAMIASALARVPCVFSYRNVMQFRRFLDVIEFLVAFSFSKKIVSNCSLERSSLAYRFLFRRKSGVCIPNAVSTPPVGVSTTTDKGDDTVRIIFVGRLVPQKNWRCLLEALGMLDRSVKWSLSICGEGEDRREAEQLCLELNIADRVSFLGYREDAIALMGDSDMLVLPSWHEGMPNVLLEAFSVGLPALVSDIPEHKAIINGTGAAVLFDPSKPNDLHKKISALAHDREHLAILRERGVQVIKEYSPDRMAQRYLSVYRDITRVPRNSGLNRDSGK